MKRLALLIVPALLAGTMASADADGGYLQWMQEHLPECPEFDAWQQQSGALPPDFDALPRTNLLPESRVFLDGTPVVTDADWERRRAEILDLFIRYEWGTMPPKPAISRVETLEESESDGIRSRTVRLWFGPEDRGSVRASVSIPAGQPGQRFPVLLSPQLGGAGNLLLQRGWISAGYAGNDFMDDGAALRELYPEYTFSALTRRAWLVSLVLDWLCTLPEVHPEQIAMYGYSRDGKMAAIAAATDSRISALVAGSTGVGGFVPWRYASERGGGESIESTTRMFPDWFLPGLRFFCGREDRLPVDANLLLDLIAPRAVLMKWGLNDEVANGWAQERVYEASLPTYARYGAQDQLSLLRVPGFHGGNDMAACLDFLDIRFGRSARKWDYQPLFNWDWEAWRRKSGERLSPADWPVRKPEEPISRDKRSWEQRRPALLAAIRQILGTAPAALPAAAPRFPGRPQPGPLESLQGKYDPGQLAPDVPAWVIGRGIPEFGWLASDNEGMASKRLRFGPDGIRADLYYPADTPEGTRLPVVIWLHGYHFPLGYMWVYHTDTHPIPALVKEGFAVLAFDQSGFGSRCGEYAPFYERYPEWSRLGRMVTDVQDAVTALLQEPLADPNRISLLGFALGGTVGLYSAALDTRIRNVVSVCGFTPMRSDTCRDGLSGLTRYSHLHNLAPRLGLFAGEEARLPYDFEELIALTAPRGVLVIQPARDRDADPAAVRRAVQHAAAAYAWAGASCRIGDSLTGPAGAPTRLELREPDDYGRLTLEMQIPMIDWLKKH
ncbi:MAG: alpha/beta fold hydrolase [Bacteroidales bacterium]|nr:alpha/beta fold hydrolase [Bacteroidales bacterium]